MLSLTPDANMFSTAMARLAQFRQSLQNIEARAASPRAISISPPTPHESPQPDGRPLSPFSALAAEGADRSGRGSGLRDSGPMHGAPNGSFGFDHNGSFQRRSLFVPPIRTDMRGNGEQQGAGNWGGGGGGGGLVMRQVPGGMMPPLYQTGPIYMSALPPSFPYAAVQYPGPSPSLSGYGQGLSGAPSMGPQGYGMPGSYVMVNSLGQGYVVPPFPYAPPTPSSKNP
jgi:hypothetical protein